MTRKLLMLMAILGWFAIPPIAISAQDNQSAEEAFKEGREAFKEAETAEEKLSIVKDFLKRFPNSDYTDYALGLGVELLTDDFKDPDRAENLIHAVVGKAEDAEVKTKVLFRLASLYGETDKMDQFVALSNDLLNDYDLKYSDLNDLGDKAIKYQAWDLAARLSDKAMPLATAEQYRADYPDMELTEDELGERGSRRKGLTLSQRGWAQIQLGKTEEGVKTLKSARGYTGTNYVGIPNTNATRYLGMALLRQSKYDEAIDLLAADAIYAGNEDALEALKKAYIGRNGNEEGFNNFKWKLRLDNARKVDPFTLQDFQDKTFDFASLKGNVVLMAFWHPN